MKMISTLLAAFTISTGLMAHGPVSSLSISQQGGKMIRIEMDGRRIQGYQPVYRLDNLAPGKHRVRIFGFRKRSALAVILGLPPSERLLYNASIRLRPGTAMHLSVGPDGVVSIREYSLSGLLAPEYERALDGDRDAGRIRPGDFSNRAPFYHPMDGQRFRDILYSLRQERRERARLSYAIRSLDGQFLSADQLIQMLRLFRKDEHRLQLARAAYPHVVDKEHFVQVYGELANRRSREELKEFLHRNNQY